MSRTQKQDDKILQDLESWIRCNVNTAGLGLDKSNTAILLDAYSVWFRLLADVATIDFVVEKKDLLLALIDQGVNAIDIMKAILLKLRLFEREAQHAHCYRNFKRSLLHNVEDCGNLILLMEPLLRHFFLESTGYTFAPLNNLLSFLGKLNLPRPELRENAIADFLKNDEFRITADSDFIHSINCVLRDWLSGFEYQKDFGLFGPGATAELPRSHASVRKKFQELHTSEMLTYVFGNPLGLSDADIAPSKVTFVPKSYSSYRTICCEPSSLMFWQKSVQVQLYQYVGEHPYLKDHITFDDQQKSRKMAQLGSMYDTYCTIDLSAASDTVVWDFVKKCFKGTPLLPLIWATRSRKYTWENEDGTSTLFVPNKCSPMGSALCFPIETLLFAAICEVVCRKTKTIGRIRYRIFGDDIVIHPNDCDVTQLIHHLETCNFRVNITKSYLSGPFREACGGEYYLGSDCSPVRFSRGFTGLSNQSFTQLVALVPMINKLLDCGYVLARRYLLSVIKKERCLRWIPFSLTGESGTICSFSATNYHLNIQKDSVVFAKEKRKPIYGKYLYKTKCDATVARRNDRKMLQTCNPLQEFDAGISGLELWWSLRHHDADFSSETRVNVDKITTRLQVGWAYLPEVCE